jgi:hypothetical protein
MPWRSANLHEQLAQPLLCQLDIVHRAVLLSAFQPRLPLLLSAFQPRLPPPRHWLLSLFRPRPRPGCKICFTNLLNARRLAQQLIEQYNLQKACWRPEPALPHTACDFDRFL